MPKGYVPFYSLAGVTSVGAGAPADTSGSTADMFIQITIAGTATVKVESSHDLNNWTDVSAVPGGHTASTILKLDARVPFYRANCTVWVSGLVTAVISSGRGRENQLMNVSSPLGALGSGGVNLANLLNDRVPINRRINTTLPLAGGGDLSVDRTLSVAITPANNGGAVALQAAAPGTAQTGNFNITGVGVVARIIAAVSGAFTAIRGDALSSGGVGVAGVGTDNAGVEGDATTGSGVFGSATGVGGVGVSGSSLGGPSGLFQSGLEANTAAALVTKRVTAGAAANLFEAQNESGAVLYSINAAGVPSFPLASNPPAVLVSNGGSITVNPTATATYTTESYDTDTMHDNAVNPSRITIRTAGVYQFIAGTGYPPNVTADRKIELKKNGAATMFVKNDFAFPSGSATQYIQVGGLMKLAVNDYVEVLLTQNSGASLDTVDNFFGATWVAVG